MDRDPNARRSSPAGTPSTDPAIFFEPTLITGLEQDDELVQQEIFGPVATVQTFTDEADALAKANAVEQGLAASVWTRDIGRALRNVNAIQCGVVWVNNHMAVGPEGPLGGFKGSGYGKEGGSAGLEEVHPRQAGHRQPVMTDDARRWSASRSGRTMTAPTATLRGRRSR